MGQIWMYGMIIQVYSSTYCRRDGFRWFIFMFGVICYVGLIAGHTFIRKFQREIPKFKPLNNQDNKIPNTTNDAKLDTPILAFNVESGNDDTDSNSSSDSDSNSSGGSSSNNSGIYDKIVKLDFFVAKVKVTMGILKKLHAICMVISLVMVTGAGSAFTIRYLDVADCQNIYSTE